MPKIALITGILGQDGSYLAELLLDKGYKVHGIVREKNPKDKKKFWRIEKIQKDLVLNENNLDSSDSFYKILEKVNPGKPMNTETSRNLTMPPEIPGVTRNILDKVVFSSGTVGGTVGGKAATGGTVAAKTALGGTAAQLGGTAAKLSGTAALVATSGPTK